MGRTSQKARKTALWGGVPGGWGGPKKARKWGLPGLYGSGGGGIFDPPLPGGGIPPLPGGYPTPSPPLHPSKKATGYRGFHTLFLGCGTGKWGAILRHPNLEGRRGGPGGGVGVGGSGTLDRGGGGGGGGPGDLKTPLCPPFPTPYPPPRGVTSPGTQGGSGMRVAPRQAPYRGVWGG